MNGEVVIKDRLSQLLISGFRSSSDFDARSLLEGHPSLMHDESAIADLAYEEYCRQRERGENPDPEEFARRFPEAYSEVVGTLLTHDYLDAHSHLLSDLLSTLWPVAGQELMGYQLIAEIGRGASARAYLAHERAVADRPVVIKVSRRRVTHEANTLGRLRHQNIVPILSVTRSRVFDLICMPYVSRSTLRDVLEVLSKSADERERRGAFVQAARKLNARSPIACPAVGGERSAAAGPFLDAALDICLQIARGLEHAHAHGIVHADIKPSNVLIANDGSVFLLDFNLSLDASGGEAFTGGTMPYMAPEQLEHLAQTGSARKIDARTDIFSCGVLLFQLICGELPFGATPEGFDGVEAARTLLERQQQGWNAEALWSCGADSRVVAVVGRCLMFEPGLRFQSSRELAEALTAALARRPRAVRWARRHPRLSLALALTALLATGLPTACWVLRPPRDLLTMRQGVRSLASGEVSQAEQCFVEVLNHDPGDQRAGFLAAVCEMRQEDFAVAHRRLRTLANTDESGRVDAALASCAYALTEDARLTMVHLRNALKKGCRTAGVLNNLGFCLICAGEFDEAASVLQECLALAPDSRRGLLNLAVADFQSALRGKRSPRLAYIRRAQRLGDPEGEVELWASWIYATAAVFGEETLAEAKAAWERAANLGVATKKLQQIQSQFPGLRDLRLPEASGEQPVARIARFVLVEDQWVESVTREWVQVADAASL